jgi:hypothetical protein
MSKDPLAKRSAGLYDLTLFVALLSTTLALGGALAHLFELPNKIPLPLDRYFIVQQIYRGWWQFAYVLAIQLLSIAGVIALSGGEPRVRRPAVVALLCLLAAQAVFWTWTQPANAATDNWTTQPANADALRRQWEYSHAAGAVFQLLAISSLFVAALRRR